MTPLTTALACVSVIALNLFATARVLRMPAADEGRRVIALALIWILPVIAAVVVLLMPAPRSTPGG